MKTIGLDIATVSGAGIIDGDSYRAVTFRARSETEERRKAREKASGVRKLKIPAEHRELHEKAASFRTWLKALLAAEEPDFVAIEAPLMGVQDEITFEDDIGGGKRMVRRAASNPVTVQLLQGLNLIAGMVCVEMGIPFELVAVSSHRKAFLGTGRPPKGEAKKLTLERCRQLGMAITSLDAADGFSVAWWAQGQAGMKHAMGRLSFG